jgi:hypothetical protein
MLGTSACPDLWLAVRTFANDNGNYKALVSM